MKAGPLGTVKMQGLFMLFGAVLACPCTSTAADVRFFRIVGPTATVITALNEDGTVTWTNNVVGVTCTVESAYSTGDDATWDRYTELVVTSSIARLRIFDPHPPADMVIIPFGPFLMGNSTDDMGTSWFIEQPVHWVTISAFYMDRYQVTKSKWDEIASWAETNGYEVYPYDTDGKAADHPAIYASWYESVAWCNARSEKEGLTPCYTVTGTVYREAVYYTNDLPDVVCDWTANGYRLPTEAEWEKAARGGATGRRFPWASTNINFQMANYYCDWQEWGPGWPYDTAPTGGYNPAFATGDQPYTSPVGSFAPNGYGLYDMAGNLFDWCWDWRSDSYYSLSPANDPRGPSTGTKRTLRGGAFIRQAYDCRCAFRHRESEAYGTPYIGSNLCGFRCARNL